MRVAVAALAVVACVDSGPGPQPKKIEHKTVQANLVSALPDDITHLDVALAGKVVYAGNRSDKPLVVPGQAVRLNHYWRVEMPPGQ